MGVPFQVTFDAASPKRLGEFWMVALNYRIDDPPPDFESWDEAIKAWGLPEDWDEVNAIIDPDGVGPRLWFQRVPEDKIAKNRVHLDVSPGPRHHRRRGTLVHGAHPRRATGRRRRRRRRGAQG